MEMDGLVGGVGQAEEDEPGQEDGDDRVEQRSAREALRGKAVQHLRWGARVPA